MHARARCEKQSSGGTNGRRVGAVVRRRAENPYDEKYGPVCAGAFRPATQTTNDGAVDHSLRRSSRS